MAKKKTAQVPQAQAVQLPSPSEIKAFLDKYVIGQDQAKKILSVAVYNHYKRIVREPVDGSVELEKSNVVLLGDTGCGKTLLVRTIARMLDVPCYIQDCTKITESGFVGSDVEDCLVGLLRSCDYDIERAQIGIVMLDECDKTAKVHAGPNITRDPSGEGVQQALLKIVEGDVVGVPPFGGRKHPEQPLLYVDTTNILFIASGAFVGLSDIVEKRMGNSGKIGYADGTARVKDKSPLRNVTPKDLRDFGMIPEFVGRFPVIANVDPLEKDDLVTILKKPKNALVKQYTELLAMDGIKLKFTPDALSAIAEEALSLGTGARGLRAVMEKVMMDVMFEAPGSKKKELVIDEKTVKDKLSVA
ncbi:MAG: ATP-dependent Clp protease ATP-binding subunit ClpX [Bacteroidales bacterium]|nr:ATP-dependent Clp protease ATP-binding subunit ClpX [Candidatus Cryptobacteroides equifaecalis]